MTVFKSSPKRQKHPAGSEEEIREASDWCRSTVLQVSPVAGLEGRLQDMVSAMLATLRTQPEYRILFSPPYTNEQRDVRHALIMWATWAARQRLDDDRIRPTPPPVPSILFLVMPARIAGRIARGRLSEADCRLIAEESTWYWSGTEQEFQDAPLAAIFAAGQEAAEEGDTPVVCLAISIPSTPVGISMTADFRERYDAIRELHRKGASLMAVTEPISSATVLTLPLRQNR